MRTDESHAGSSVIVPLAPGSTLSGAILFLGTPSERREYLIYGGICCTALRGFNWDGSPSAAGSAPTIRRVSAGNAILAHQPGDPISTLMGAYRRHSRLPSSPTGLAAPRGLGAGHNWKDIVLAQAGLSSVFAGEVSRTSSEMKPAGLVSTTHQFSVSVLCCPPLIAKIAVAGALHDGLRARELYVGTTSLGEG